MLWQWHKRFTYKQHQQICSQWVHADLQLVDFWEELIASQRQIGVVNSCPAVAERIRRWFGVDVNFIDIPDSGYEKGAASQSTSIVCPRRPRITSFSRRSIVKSETQ